MSTANVTHLHVGGKSAVIIFIFTLLAFVIESELTQYVQTTLHYRHPFFIFYLVHSSFFWIFPSHVLYLSATTKYSFSALMNGLGLAIANHLSLKGTPDSSSTFPRWKFLRLVLALTAGITIPGLLWFAAVSLASVSDVTAIWNTNAFFAYIITVKLFNLEWHPRRLAAVLLATLGTVAVVYGGSTAPSSDDTSAGVASIEQRAPSFKPSAPLFGDLLTLVASFGYGLYQVLYKKYAALSSDPEMSSGGLYERLPPSDDVSSEEFNNVPRGIGLEDAVYPPPFGFHPNALTSAIGLCTFGLLWIPIPILHYLGIEQFTWPANFTTIFAISGIALSGIVFNSGFMVLLGIWGPIITSVGNLLTIVLVFFSDVFFGAGYEAVTGWSLAGSCVIVAAFGVLAYDMSS